MKYLIEVEANEMLKIGGGIYCLAINIEKENVGALIFRFINKTITKFIQLKLYK